MDLHKQKENKTTSTNKPAVQLAQLEQQQNILNFHTMWQGNKGCGRCFVNG